MNLIEQLKDPKQAQAFGIYQQYYPQKAETLKNAGKENLLYHDAPKWRTKKEAGFYSYSTYILKPDYQPEPEYVDYLIEICEDAKCEEGNFLGVKENLDNSPILPHEHTYLYCLPSLPRFDRFFIEGGQTIYLEHCAGSIDSGKKVYARFRTGE